MMDGNLGLVVEELVYIQVTMYSLHTLVVMVYKHLSISVQEDRVCIWADRGC
jgi:hypothetical protein